MAKRKQKSRKNNNLEAQKRRGKSVLTKKELHLNKHDEEKVVLFAAGMLFGIGISAGILGSIVYSGFVAIILALVLLLIEARQEMK
ncbi:MAG: hypothetical protein HY513_00635 [Candidatus Aenigmarchaeota archaeon]|nr:hypothetical protein [Candidatus Aenigmarchaeota archaeon]